MKVSVDLNKPRLKHTSMCGKNHLFSSVQSSQRLIFCIPDAKKGTVFVIQSYAFFNLRPILDYT
jgi:hypothetical protein